MHPLERELQGEESRLPRFKQKAEEVKVHPIIAMDSSSMTNYEQHHEKTCLWSFRPDPTQTGLYSHRRCLET